MIAAETALKTAQDALDKQRTAYNLNSKSISKDAIDAAVNAADNARASLEVARKQRDLTKAGAWIFDINNQEKAYNAAYKSYLSASALGAKYTLRAPDDAKVLAVNPIVGSYVSPQGSYDSYTQAMTPMIVLGARPARLNVRCYVDEILVPKLPDFSRMKAQMTIRGSNAKIPLQFVRAQPLVSPKIELSNQRQERVDVRVLPVIFRFDVPSNMNLYPGLLVDIYIGG